MRNINEKCAVIAVSNQDGFDASRLVYFGLWAMQHRGQDGSGIASYDGIKLHSHKKNGLVSNVYDEESLGKLIGHQAIGHNRYTTNGGKDERYNQPYVVPSQFFAFAHNGNLPFTAKLLQYADDNQLFADDLNDSGLMALALGNELKKNKSIVDAVSKCWELFTGAFSCVGLYENIVFSFRDEFGIRPLSIGKTEHGYVIASETVAFDIIGAEFVRDVKPGELVFIQDGHLKSVQIKQGHLMIDAFEFVYLARPDSKINGLSVYSARYRAGQELSKIAPVEADVVIGIPDSGLPAAAGYAQSTKLQHEPGLLKNRYIGRTFIEPEKIRKNSVELKFSIIPEIVKNRNIVLIDDSLVRGNTLKHVIQKLRSYGAVSVHVRIASPPIRYPDFYGIDTPNASSLIASEYSEEQIAKTIGADSLAYLSLDKFVRSIGLPIDNLCLSSFNGVYPIEVPYKIAVK